MGNLPAYISYEEVSKRIAMIFSEGIENRSFLIRDLGISTIFTMLYIGAVEGNDTYLGPKHVVKMTDKQSERTFDIDRLRYASIVLKPGYKSENPTWYADNSRESIRDETLREGFVRLGVVKIKPDVVTTSSRPRYYLTKAFTALFDPKLIDDKLAKAIEHWQKENLSTSAQIRVKLASLGKSTDKHEVVVTFPNKETRLLSPGDSSEISKAVIEDFAHRFLENPGLLWLSTSGNKVVQRDQSLANAIGLNIDASRNLPDIILVDIRPEETILLVFVEVVATDGAITPSRQEAIYQLTDQAGFHRNQVAFVTAYLDRNSGGFKKTITGLAWNSFAWFVSEPDNIVVLKGNAELLSKLIDRG